jgi:adenylate cyclase
MQPEKRRLAAILVADIAGYSRLVGQDEEGTLQALRSHRQDLIDPLVGEHEGRIANTAGDSLLIEFASAVDALRYAIAMQEGMAARNSNLEGDHQIRFRIGINIGDVIAEGDDLLGDGVNVAARIQGQSEPGGIFIANSVFEQTSGKIDLSFDDLGYRKLKNIAQPVHVYRIHLPDSPEHQRLPELFVRPTVDPAPLAGGGCMCGAVRYEISQPAIGTGLCHCRMCQKFNSAPFSVWTTFPIEAVRLTRGEPKYYTSSPIGERGFCAECGASLTMRYHAPEHSDVLAILASTLDHPEDYAPNRHGGTESKMPWLDLNDSLPRYRSEESTDLNWRWTAVGRPDPADWK